MTIQDKLRERAEKDFYDRGWRQEGDLDHEAADALVEKDREIERLTKILQTMSAHVDNQQGPSKNRI